MNRDFETIRRSFQRKFGWDNSESPTIISGEAFMNLCDDILTIEVENLLFDNFGEKRFFLAADLVPEFIQRLELTKNSFGSRHTLVIHNGDLAISETQLNVLSNSFEKIYSVNLLHKSEKALPIPIGLENQSILRNGVVKDYRKLRQNGLPDWSSRKFDFFACFNTATNLSERLPALRTARKLTNCVNREPQLTPRQYRSFLANSKFVISPPGNGPDCHRTWEAILLGAIPIVKRQYWPFVDYDLPVIIINDWEELLDLEFVDFQDSFDIDDIFIPKTWLI